jgi:hypothetical protein
VVETIPLLVITNVVLIAVDGNVEAANDVFSVVVMPKFDSVNETTLLLESDFSSSKM